MASPSRARPPSHSTTPDGASAAHSGSHASPEEASDAIPSRGYGTGRLRPSTPDEEEQRPCRKGRKQVGVEVPIGQYAQVDAVCRRRNLSIAGAVREALALWCRVQRH